MYFIDRISLANDSNCLLTKAV